MKIRETLTNEEYLEMLNGTTVGVFPTVFTDLPVDEEFIQASCVNYYTIHSSEKLASKILREVIELKRRECISGFELESAIGILINRKFIDKWSKIYEDLNASYSSLNEFERTESYDKSHNNKKIYDTTIINDGRRGSKLVTTTEDTSNNSIYGFNSSVAVGDSSSTYDTTETTIGNVNDNTSHNIETKLGTDSENITIDESKTVSGRNTSPSKLLQDNIDFRTKNIFLDIVFRDIDSVITLGVY